MKRCLSLLVLAALLLLPAAAPAADQDTLYQVSTIDALLSGVYDGKTTAADLLKHGDLGLGTFNGLDGEMIVAGGKVYQVGMDGKAKVMPPDTLTPFAGVTFFEADMTFKVPAGLDYAGLKKFMAARLPSQNLFYAVRLKGSFKKIKARSVPRQTKPYPPLVQVVKKQAVFHYAQVKGQLVGFFSPAFVKGVGVPGWHLHFLEAARKKGGHLLNCLTGPGVLEVDVTPQFLLALPRQGGFLKSDLQKDQSKALHQVEQDKH